MCEKFGINIPKRDLSKLLHKGSQRWSSACCKGKVKSLVEHCFCVRVGRVSSPLLVVDIKQGSSGDEGHFVTLWTA